MNKLFKFLKVMFLIATIIFAFDQGRMLLLGYKESFDWNNVISIFSFYLLYTVAFGLANYWVVYELQKRYSWEEHPKKRAIYGVIGAILFSMLTIILLRFFTVMIVEGNDWAYFIKNETIFVYLYSLVIAIVVVLIFYVIHFYKAITTQKITEHKTIAKTEIAKYESLKSQLDPHFLFNSLNVLTSLIEENPERAEVFTTKLSKVYRYVLEQKEKALVPLEEEIDFAIVYMDLLKMRFEGAIHFTIPKHFSNDDYKIVPLSLQLLLENAVKHNVISENIPLKISISEIDGQLIISNNFNQKKTVKKGAGIGLNNIIERYALLTEREVAINKTKESFDVTLPLLTQKTSIMKKLNTTEENKYFKAKERVEKMKEFYANLVSYLGVNTFLIFVNYYTGWHHKWFVYPLIGWGIGLLFHYFEAFGYYPFLSKNWEEKKIKELMDDEKKEMWK